MIVCAVVKNQNFYPLFAGQQKEKVGNLYSQGQHEFMPVIAWILQRFIGCILFEWQARASIGDYSPVEICAPKRKHEDDREKSQGRNPPHLPYSAFIVKGADLKISNERRNSVMQPFCFLLLLMLSGNIHFGPFSLIYCCFRKTNIPRSKGLSVIICIYFSLLIKSRVNKES